MSAPQEINFVTDEQVEAAVKVIQEWDNGSLICINVGCVIATKCQV